MDPGDGEEAAARRRGRRGRQPEPRRGAARLVVPTLVLVRGAKILGRLEGRVTGREITRLIGPHVDGSPNKTSVALERSANSL